jgi:hypothetical protein
MTGETSVKEDLEAAFEEWYVGNVPKSQQTVEVSLLLFKAYQTGFGHGYTEAEADMLDWYH